METGQRDRLRKQHDFAEWQGTDADAGAPAVRGFHFTGHELPGWEMVKARRNDALEPARLDSFWRPKGDRLDTLLAVQVIECASVPAAREALLEALGEFQSAAIVRRTDLDLGDVVFGQEMTLVFARTNLVIFVRNAGRNVVPVLEPARVIDAHIRGLRAIPG